MAFTYGELEDVDTSRLGNGTLVRIGWFKSTGASTGGTIKTAMKTVYILLIQIHAIAVGGGPVVNMITGDVEVAMNGDIIIVTDAAAVGRWLIMGV